MTSPSTTSHALLTRALALRAEKPGTEAALAAAQVAAALAADCQAWLARDWRGELFVSLKGLERMLNSQLDLLSLAERRVQNALGRALAVEA